MEDKKLSKYEESLIRLENSPLKLFKGEADEVKTSRL